MIKLKKHSDKRISRGHLWVFSNEIASPEISQLNKGEVHELFDFSDNFLGMAYVNPNSLISARIVSRDRTQIDYSFVRSRIHEANQRRLNVCHGSDSYRLFYGESDLLPGLIIDKYGGVYVIQSSTAGVDLLMDMIVQAIIDLFSPESIYIRNDLPVRDLEGIPRDKKLVYGYLPEPITISLNRLRFAVDVANGQKTGFFLDQEFNRASFMKYLVPNSRVLDLFCYSGAWAINSAARKSCNVTAIDSSASALDLARMNAELNHVKASPEFLKSDCVDFLKKNDQCWDVIIADPPAFIKSKSKQAEGKRGYLDLNKRAMMRLKSGGILVTCSCSHHLTLDDFKDVVLSASFKTSRRLRVLEILGQGPDHPSLLSMPETSYLKVMICQVI